MKPVFVLFDSLNRASLEPYGGSAARTPNFSRLAARAVTFDTHYVGSLPCMPARRDMHTGRLSLLHRSWGPLEPFDDSFAELLHANGVYTHLVSDHYHHWEDGGATRDAARCFVPLPASVRRAAQGRPPDARLGAKGAAPTLRTPRPIRTPLASTC